MAPPWSIRVIDHAPLTVVCVVHGNASIVFDDDETVSLEPGDTALVRGPDEYVVADRPGSPPQVLIHPGQRCEPIPGASSPPVTGLGVRTWGNRADGTSVLLTGTYHADGEVSRPLLNSLPRCVALRSDEWSCALVDLLAEEMTNDTDGQEVVLDRLLDLIVIEAARTYLANDPAPSAGWYRAQFDPIAGPALAAIHTSPGRAWTVQSLAQQVGASRASLARRFADTVGTTPIAYLTEHRLALAADLLAETDDKVATIADKIGYSSAFALSTAFKRSYSVSPTQYRRHQRRSGSTHAT